MTGAIPTSALSRDHPPAFHDSPTCREWLRHLPLASPAQAQAQLLAQLNLLNGYALDPLERLRMLELLREPARFTLNECARRFAGRALPLTSGEASAFEANRRTAQALANGYRHCLEACLAGAQDACAQAGLIAERSLSALAVEQLDHYRASAQLSPQFWRRLHDLYSVAEELAVAEQAVHDKLLSARPVSSRSLWITSLLLHAASVYELPVRQLDTLRGWLLRWSAQVPVGCAASAEARLPPLVADLASAGPAQFAPTPKGNLRWLDVDRLAGKLKRRLRALGSGASVESLGLGAECRADAAEALLRHAYEHCCKGGIPRRKARRLASGECRVAAGAEAIHYHMTGRRFDSGEAKLSKRQVDEIATFGRLSSRESAGGQAAPPVERWRLVDESAAGLRLARQPGAAGARLARGQLIALVPPGGSTYLLAGVHWIMTREGGEIQAGAHLLPGLARPVAVRPAGVGHAKDPWRPGFLLPAVPALESPASLVLPLGWFRPERKIAILGEDPVQLTKVLERGSDYERVEVAT